MRPRQSQHNIAKPENNAPSFGLFPDFFPTRRLEIREQIMSEEELIIKKKETAAKYLRKILLGKVRQHFKEVKANAWHYYN
jgi:hypothetical protein